MSRLVTPCLFSLAVSLAATGVASAQTGPLMIDNFVTGPVTATLNGAHQTVTLNSTTTQTGTGIIGGTRYTGMSLLLAANPYRQNASVRIQKGTKTVPGGLVFDQGFQADAVMSVDYGEIVGTASPSLNLNLTPYTSFRVTFAALSGGDLFNILAYSNTVGYSQWGCNIPASTGPYVVDFPIANGDGDMNPADVSALIFEFQSSGGAFGNQFGISSIQLVTSDATPANLVCPAITSSATSR